MERMIKRISAILVLVLVFSLMPHMTPTGFAASSSTTIDVSDTTTGQTLPTGVTYSAITKIFTIGTGAAIGTTITVSGITTQNAIIVATSVTGITLVLNGVSITSSAISPISLIGNANVTIQLADESINTLNASGATNAAGLSTNGTATVNITGTGSLTAIGGANGAGIGGGNAQAGGTINISDGTVVATGGQYGAGIGGGSTKAGGTITISGGDVAATGGSNGAGIGSGVNGTLGATITISGGKVAAIGGPYGAGIGGGGNSASGTITISGGTVDATGSQGGTGIGGGNAGANVAITISDGVVTAKGNSGGAGIGGGSGKAGGIIIISGGMVSATGGNSGTGIGSGLYDTSGGTINISGGTVTSIGGSTAVAGFGSVVDAITIDASAVVMAASKSDANTPAIQGVSGSSGSAINAKLTTAISTSTTTYLKCGENVLPLPANYKGFAFSAATASAVGVYSDLACTNKIHNIVTYSGGATEIPLSTIASGSFTSVTTAVPLTGTVNLDIDPATGQVTASAIGGNTASTGALLYTWTGGASGTGTSTIPALGVATTCTVTKAGISGAIQATTTVYKVTVSEAGITGEDDASITNASITKAYGKVGDSISINYTLDGSGTLSNTLTYSGAGSNPIAVSTGAVSTPITGTSIYTIASGDAINGTIALTATFAHTNAAIPETGGSRKQRPSDATILINGEAVNIGTSKETIVEGKTVTTVTLDEGKLDQMLDQLLEEMLDQTLEQMPGAEENQPKVIIPILTNSDVQVCELNGQILSNLDDKQAVLEIQTDTATYTLSGQDVDMEGILEELGMGVDLKDIKVTIEIAKASEDTVLLVENAAKEGEFTIIAPPVEFRVSCAYGDKTIEVKEFDNYVERGMAIPEGVDPSKITTGIIIDAAGMARHVPTKVVIIDGKYYAKINSLTNSTYSVIWNPVEFSDVEKHWAKAAVNEMGSRMVISGVGNGLFQPERGITRGEFATILVRSLGLQPGTGNNKFTDVKTADWYRPYIETAYEYGILSGYNQAKFGPRDQMTREQAMTMVARAMKITGLQVEFEANEAEKLLGAYVDGQESANWSKESMAECIKAGIVSGNSWGKLEPKDKITRAEVTVIVQRLLEKSSLI